MDFLFQLFRSLIDRIDTTYVRYLHDEIDWRSRMISIVGARGVGKTTLLLQHIKLHHNLNDTLYVSADNIYFSDNRLFDLAMEFQKLGGKYLFIDEVHKYPDWSKELKMMYDNLPGLKIVFTGSSVLDIFRGTDDLSRRVLTYNLAGLSFREYLNISQGVSLPAFSLEDIIANRGVDLKLIVSHPLMHFREYLEGGYYPFFNEPGYDERLRNVLNLTLETDIPTYANMNIATARKLKQLLYIISQSVPFKPVFTKISNLIGVHRNQLADLFYYLEKAGIISQLRESTKGIKLLGKVEKVFLNNTNLIYALAEEKPNIGNVRETFFYNQMSVKNDVFSSDKADFMIKDMTFEVGGKNKGQRQVKGVENAHIVKDDIEYGQLNIIPLWAFGFNY